MTSQWQFQPVFGSYLLVTALASVLLLLLVVRPSFGSLGPRRRGWLNLLRAAIVLLLLFAMLRPTYIRTEAHSQSAKVIVLYDASRSMDHRDGEDGSTRWEQQLTLLHSVTPQLKDMGDSFSVDVMEFSAGVTAAEGEVSVPPPQSKPLGEETDIGNALQEILHRNTGKRIAGVILLSDGAQRAIAPQISPQQATRLLYRRSSPLYTIALGRSRDQSQSRDVAIENLQDEYSVFVKNEFALRVGVRIQGYVNQPIATTVVVEDEQGKLTTLGPQQLVATEDSQIVMADFSFRPESAGQYILRVEAARQPGELIENNASTAFLNVREGGLRVLLLSSGLLSAERQFIERALNESPDIEVDFQHIDLLLQDQWPLDLQSLVTLEDYDVFVIGELDARAIDAESWSSMANLVDSGRGLMMYGGYHSFGPGGYSETALADVLPIEMSRIERELSPTRSERVDRHLDGEIVMLPNPQQAHPVTHIAPDDQNRQTWESLKPLRGANRFDKLKDQAVVLAESRDGQPLLVAGTFVAGRVLALAADSTFRWWRYGRRDIHKKFWRQSVLWLAHRDKKDANTVFIDLPQRRYQARQRVTFTTGLTDEVGDILADANLKASVLAPDGTSQAIALADGAEGTVGVVPATEQGGKYRLQVDAVDGDTVIASAQKDFVIEKKDFELSDPAANPGLLGMLARITSPVGGKAIAPEQLSGLLRDIKAAPPKDQIETQSTWRLGDTEWDAWTFFLLLVGLLSTEWFLRKRWGLV